MVRTLGFWEQHLPQAWWEPLRTGGCALALKTGGWSRTLRVVMRDVESQSEADRALCNREAARAFARPGDGWMWEFNTVHRPAPGYPKGGEFPDASTRLVEDAQRLCFLEEGVHFESETFCTLSYQSPSPRRGWAERWLFGLKGEREASLMGLDEFERESNDLIDPLRAWFELVSLDAGETISFVEGSITGISNTRLAPPYEGLLNGSFAHEFITGYRPQIDGRTIIVVAIDTFPAASYPQILSGLCGMRGSFRLWQRFICQSPHTAEALFETLDRNWRQRRHNFTAIVTRVMGGEPRENPFALEMAADVAAARLEAETHNWQPGLYTGGVTVIDHDRAQAERVANEAIRELCYRGFAARLETLNNNEAYLSSLPANGGYNPRRPIVSSRNFADLVVNDTPPAGAEHHPCPYYPPNSPPLMMALTSSATPIRLTPYVGDVGHTKISGPTGLGKTTLVGYMLYRHRCYPNSQQFAIDRGYGLFVPTLAAGGTHFDLGADEVPCAPLIGVDDPAERAWAHEWLVDRLREQGLAPTPERDRALLRGLEILAQRSRHARTITEFQATVQNQEIGDALTFYTLAGPLGRFLDADHDALTEASFITLEFERLMAMGDRFVLPMISYFLHRFEQRLDGRPTTIVLEEMWALLQHQHFALHIERYPRTLRKKNAAVILVTQSLTDIANSPLRDLILESCPTKIYLPNPEARNPATAELYRKFGLSDRQIDLIAGAIPKHQYYWVSQHFRRLFSIPFTEPALAFLGAGSSEQISLAKKLHRERGDAWPAEWLRIRGLPRWAEYWERLGSSRAAERPPVAADLFTVNQQNNEVAR